mmetsp:Transcript_6244/g.19704  ORF Transcript_6244/g.19704 Transcript_6244/m.19704 type:complete len:218 (-) Transcript_6244:534-1187(-)
MLAVAIWQRAATATVTFGVRLAVRLNRQSPSGAPPIPRSDFCVALLFSIVSSSVRAAATFTSGRTDVVSAPSERMSAASKPSMQLGRWARRALRPVAQTVLSSSGLRAASTSATPAPCCPPPGERCVTAGPNLRPHRGSSAATRPGGPCRASWARWQCGRACHCQRDALGWTCCGEVTPASQVLVQTAAAEIYEVAAASGAAVLARIRVVASAKFRC